jgi:hypothetical protein
MLALRVLREEAQHVEEVEDSEDGSKGVEEACVNAAVDDDEVGTCNWEAEALPNHPSRMGGAGQPGEDTEEGSPHPERMAGGCSARDDDQQLPGYKVQVPMGTELEVAEMEVSPFAASFGLAAKLLE